MDIRPAPQAKTMSRAAINEYAEEVFDLHNVAYRIHRAAKAGRDSVQLSQEKPADLSGTDAAYRLVMHLEGLGYATSWDEIRRMEVVPRHEVAREVVYCELVIEWFERLFVTT